MIIRIAPSGHNFTRSHTKTNPPISHQLI